MNKFISITKVSKALNKIMNNCQLIISECPINLSDKEIVYEFSMVDKKEIKLSGYILLEDIFKLNKNI